MTGASRGIGRRIAEELRFKRCICTGTATSEKGAESDVWLSLGDECEGLVFKRN